MSTPETSSCAGDLTDFVNHHLVLQRNFFSKGFQTCRFFIIDIGGPRQITAGYGGGTSDADFFSFSFSLKVGTVSCENIHSIGSPAIFLSTGNSMTTFFSDIAGMTTTGPVFFICCASSGVSTNLGVISLLRPETGSSIFSWRTGAAKGFSLDATNNYRAFLFHRSPEKASAKA